MWKEIIGKEITQVIYCDEYGKSGSYVENIQAHYLQQGYIIIGFSDNSFYEIYNEAPGLSIFPLEEQKPSENRINEDRQWSRISSKIIYDINFHTDYLFIEQKGKRERIELISTIELIFMHGEKIFITNAGYVTKSDIMSLTDDFLIYYKKKVGIDLKLISV